MKAAEPQSNTVSHVSRIRLFKDTFYLHALHGAVWLEHNNPAFENVPRCIFLFIFFFQIGVSRVSQW